MTSPNDQDLIRKNARMGRIVLGVVVGMVGLSFASVPLYSLFCNVTGFGGTTQTAKILPDTILDRQITIKFNADTAPNMPWIFQPEMREVILKIGQRGFTTFMAKNKNNTDVTGTAIYNVTPLKAGKYFHKIQCFCFDEQTLKPHEQVSMPVVFFVDPSIETDPNMDDVKVITLSYTFFRGESKELEDAVEEFYNDESDDIEHTN